jgi:hypothetical protein
MEIYDKITAIQIKNSLKVENKGFSSNKLFSINFSHFSFECNFLTFTRETKKKYSDKIKPQRNHARSLVRNRISKIRERE